MKKICYKTILIVIMAIFATCNKPIESPIDKPEEIDEPVNSLAKAFLEYFDKDRLMIGAMAEDPFFQQNPNLLDVRYIYLADRIFRGPEVPTQYHPEDGSWWGWWQAHNLPPGQYLRDFLNKTESAGQIPMITYYTFAQTSGNESQVYPANDVSFLTRYFNDWRFMLQQIGDRKAIIHLEPDLWGYAMHRQKDSPKNIPAVVKAANPQDGITFEDNFCGFVKCLLFMVRKYAPNAKVGLHVSAWATGEIDLNINTNPNFDMNAQVTMIGNYILDLGVAETDFLTVEALDRDADYYRINRNEDRWWDTQNQKLPHFKQHFQWVKDLNEIINKPLVWWQIPLGNSNSPNTNASYPFQGMQGYKDNRVDYFLTNTNEIVSLGGVLIAFGAGAGNQTNPMTDGGNFVQLVNNYKNSNAGKGVISKWVNE